MVALAQRPQGKLQKEVLVEGPKMIAEALACGWVPSALVLDSKLKELPEAEVQSVLQPLLAGRVNCGSIILCGC